MGTWREEFEKRTDRADTDYFWLTGYYHNGKMQLTPTSMPLTDLLGCAHNIDLTNYKEMDVGKRVK